MAQWGRPSGCGAAASGSILASLQILESPENSGGAILQDIHSWRQKKVSVFA